MSTSSSCLDCGEPGVAMSCSESRRSWVPSRPSSWMMGAIACARVDLGTAPSAVSRTYRAGARPHSRAWSTMTAHSLSLNRIFRGWRRAASGCGTGDRLALSRSRSVRRKSERGSAGSSRTYSRFGQRVLSAQLRVDHFSRSFDARCVPPVAGHGCEGHSNPHCFQEGFI